MRDSASGGSITEKEMTVRDKLAIAVMMLVLSACAPEVGSKAWCDAMKEKDKGEWTANDAADFAKHCLFGGNDE